MGDPHADSRIKNIRTLIRKIASFPAIKNLLDEARADPKSPWFLEDGPKRVRHSIALFYGKLRRLGVTIRTTVIVLNAWWNHPFEPMTASNGSMLLSNSLSGIVKPVLWMASVGIAGAVGADFANSSSNVVSAVHIKIWISSALLLAFILVLYHWWKLLDRLRRVLINWVTKCREMDLPERRRHDISLFGYTFGEIFRERFKLKGVKFLSLLTYSAFLYVNYLFAHR